MNLKSYCLWPNLRQRETKLLRPLWRRAYARNVSLYFPYRQYTNLFIFRFVSEHCLRSSTPRLFHNCSIDNVLPFPWNSAVLNVLNLMSAFSFDGSVWNWKKKLIYTQYAIFPHDCQSGVWNRLSAAQFVFMISLVNVARYTPYSLVT